MAIVGKPCHGSIAILQETADRAASADALLKRVMVLLGYRTMTQFRSMYHSVTHKKSCLFSTPFTNEEELHYLIFYYQRETIRRTSFNQTAMIWSNRKPLHALA